LKPSPQTPLTAERFALALKRAGVPPDVIQVVHLSPQLTSHAISNPSVAFVSFTGSVAGGRSVAKAASTADGFTGVALEVRSLVSISYTMLTFFLKLGGKDPAYVRPDADLDYTVAELVDGGSSL
jgi:acyl-CoA reductase-like NAD-dependent aldehyde dehydrogenase